MAVLRVTTVLLLVVVMTSKAVEFPVMNVPQLIQYWGYPVESHWITTSDGYILNYHRIPYGSSEKGHPRSLVRGKGHEGRQQQSKPVMFLQHGLFGSSARFTAGPPEKSLAFIMADAGYDVWVANTRGNTYCRNHTTLDPDVDKEEFWNFDWEVAGLEDLQAGFSYVLETTGQSKLIYVGHSMGTSEFLAASAVQPEIQVMVSAAFLLAPPSYFDYNTGILVELAQYVDELEGAFEFLDLWELFPDFPLTSEVGHDLCDEIHLEENYDTCMSLADSIVGISPGNLNNSMLPIYFDSWPEGSSVKCLVHYGQLINSEHFFGRYDYGDANMEHYGQASPPAYDLSKITLPIHIFYGDGDTLVDDMDVEALASNLPNVKLLYKVPFEGWTHNDMCYAIQAPELVYSVIMENAAKYV
ncbi:gastric triacylglycerol lipase-like [Tigriopus californicus]|uniref:gastric triacylglycerol lipase-like n=1 Tax=Tigriopus californicus TaxID=6832 RepID=UPI0027DA6B98|nr:gastric triacylglycerol lipase-like [Tigriopus californicus]